MSASLRQALEHLPFGTARDGDRHAVEWAQVACAWHVAERSGAPLAECLGSFVAALRQADAARREVEVALSGPRSTGRIVLALPAGGSPLLPGARLRHRLGALRQPGGVGLPRGGRSARARRPYLERSAGPLGRPERLRAGPRASSCSPWPSPGAGPGRAASTSSTRPVGTARQAGAEDDGGGETVLELSRRAGAPAGALLRAAAAERRLDATTAARSAASRLGSTLMLPLGVCVLPAFLVVGVVPLVVALLSSTAEVL